MSEKNEIDGLFRRGLGDKGMDYSPAYWEEMQSLMRRKKRKALVRGIWVSTLILLLLPAYWTIKDHGPWTIKDHGPRTMDDSLFAEKKDDRPWTMDDSLFAEKKDERPGTRDHSKNQKQEQKPQLKDNNQALENHGLWSMDYGLKEKQEAQLKDNNQPVTIYGPWSMVYGLSITPKPILIEEISAKTEKLRVSNLQPVFSKKAMRPPLTQISVMPYFNYGFLNYRTDNAVRTWKADKEKTGPSVQYGISLRASRGRFSLVSGLGIRQWSEVTNYSQEVHQYDFDTSFLLVDRQFILRPDGTYAALVKTQIDTVSHTVSSTIPCKDCLVQFRYITFPLALQYEFGKGRWKYYAGAGLTFSFLNRVSGIYSVEWESGYGQPGGMRTASAGSHLYKTTMQADLSFGLRYRILPRLSLCGQLNYQRSLNSMMRQYKQEADLYNVGLGIEWRLY